MDPNREQVRRLFHRLHPYCQKLVDFYCLFPLYLHVIFFSLLCWTLVLSHFMVEHQQFYPAVIAISKSKMAQILIEIECAVLCYFLYKLLVYIFFSPLTAFEREEMNESNWIHLMDSLLFLTLLREQTGLGIFGELVILTITKGLVMLADMRVDIYAVAQEVCRLSHAKNLVILFTAIYSSSRLMESAYHRLIDKTESEVHHLVLVAEHLLIITAVFYTLFKYKMFHYFRQNPAYHSKEEHLKGAEVVICFIRCVIYLALVLYITVHDTTPLFLFRNLYHSTRDFADSFMTWRRARAAIRDLEKNIFDISAEELVAMDDHLCAICRDEMTTETRQKRLNCGHCFHMQCMRDWFQRQPRCPTCRADIYANPIPPSPPPLEPVPDADDRLVDGLFAAMNHMPGEVLRLSNRLARMANDALDGEGAPAQLPNLEVHLIPLQPPPTLRPDDRNLAGMSRSQLIQLHTMMLESIRLRSDALDQMLHLTNQAQRDMRTELENTRRVHERIEEIDVTLPVDPDWERPIEFD